MSPLRLVPVLLLLGACAGDDDGGGDGDGPGGQADAAGSTGDGAAADAPASRFADDIVKRSCAPNDGPALTFALGADHDPETCTIDFDHPNLTISIYLDEWEVSAPATFTFDAEDLAGSAESCPGGDGPCRQATAGEIHIDSYVEGEAASGTYQLTTEVGDMTGSFDASWCEGEGGGPYCG